MRSRLSQRSSALRVYPPFMWIRQGLFVLPLRSRRPLAARRFGILCPRRDNEPTGGSWFALIAGLTCELRFPLRERIHESGECVRACWSFSWRPDLQAGATEASVRCDLEEKDGLDIPALPAPLTPSAPGRIIRTVTARDGISSQSGLEVQKEVSHRTGQLRGRWSRERPGGGDLPRPGARVNVAWRKCAKRWRDRRS